MKKRNPITIVTGCVLALIFLLFLFAFQVRETEVAVVTRFGKFADAKQEPGLYFRLPYPIHSIHTFDKRIHDFERTFEQTTTADAKSLNISVFIGWRIAEPEVFLERFRARQGEVRQAEDLLENLVRNTKNNVIGRHPFAHLISPNPNELKFDEIEQEMLEGIQTVAREEYGIEVVLLGIKQLGLPESTTEAVFGRMREERQREVKRFIGEGDKEARMIRANADSIRRSKIDEANSKAIEMEGQADAEASKHYEVFEQNPDLAMFLFELKALESALKERATIILDERTPPFNRLHSTDATSSEQ